MINLIDKRFYKVISLFIKAILLIASFYYSIQKLTTPDALVSYHRILFSNTAICYLLSACVLMFFNWSLEAIKWQILLSNDEEISWQQSLQSIFSGITLSIFTPNRVGEFTGRIFFLKKADRFIASLKSIIGGLFQLTITMIGGITGIWLYIRNGYNVSAPLVLVIDHQHTGVLLFTTCSLLILSLILIRLFFFTKFKYHFKKITHLKRKDWLFVFLLSLARYIVFTVQYYLLVVAMGVEVECFQACTLIAIIFFITSVIPSFALTEIVIRSAVAVYIFNILEPAQPAPIASASLLLWIINLAIPALIGSIFVGKLQFFKTH